MDFFPPDTARRKICTGSRLRLRPLTVGHGPGLRRGDGKARTQLNHWAEPRPTPTLPWPKTEADLERHQREHTEGGRLHLPFTGPDGERWAASTSPATPAPPFSPQRMATPRNVSFWIRSDVLEDGLDSHLPRHPVRLVRR